MPSLGSPTIKMSTLGHRFSALKALILLNVSLKLCLTLLVINCAIVGAISSGQFSIGRKALDGHKSSMNLSPGSGSSIDDEDHGSMHLSLYPEEHQQNGHLSILRHPYSSMNKMETVSNAPADYTCNVREDVVTTQDVLSYLPNGMPIFHVTVTNTCLDCPFTNIHIACGDFSSATLVDPTIFRKEGPNDCLVNNGEALDPQNTVAFEYSTSFAYSMTVSEGTEACSL